MILKFRVPIQPLSKRVLQNRFTILAAAILFLYTASLTLAPFARYQTWDLTPDFRPWVGFGLWLAAYLITQFWVYRFLPDADLIILPIVYLLAGIGILTIWRISPGLGIRQNIWLLVGSAGLLFTVWLPHLFVILRRYRAIWMIAILGLVLMTVLPGILEEGSQPSLWINLFGFTLQPSEPLKLAIIIYLAAYFSDRLTLQTASWSAIIPSIIMIGLGLVLLLLQRDLGTASLLLALYIFVIYLVSRKRRVVLVTGVFLILALLIGYTVIDVVKLRIDAWINPWLDPTDRSYQIVQSLISIASGGVLGTGPGMGYPALVPVAVSDFIFSAIAEELGFVGGAVVICLIIILFSRYVRSTRFAEDAFTRLLASGAAVLTAIQSLLIIGGNIRLFPLTGVTLPYISYGGSSLLTCMVIAGLVLRITQLRGQHPPTDQIELTLRKIAFPVISAGLALCIILLPYWSVIRQNNLTHRSDNLRRPLNDRFVKRGTILDRNNLPINQSIGETGAYQRDYLYPDLGIITGYADPVYGLAGVEQSLDAYLRGEAGYSSIDLWWNKLLRSQPLPGLDVRLSLDLAYQDRLDVSLKDFQGAAVLLNARTGEILGMSSHPNFDPAALDDEWQNLTQDETSPLLNRAVVGKYPAGTVSGVFLYAQSVENQLTIPEYIADSVSYKGREVKCAVAVDQHADVKIEALQKSCPETNLAIARILGRERIYALYQQLGWYAAPSFSLQHAEITAPTEIDNLKAASIGQEGVTITPLQMALAAAAFSNDGMRPSPRLVQAYHSPSGTWDLISNPLESTRVFSTRTARDVQETASLESLPAWAVIGSGISGTDHTVSWFIGGTTAEWKGTPLTLVIMAEDTQNSLMYQKGKELMRSFVLNN